VSNSFIQKLTVCPSNETKQEGNVVTHSADRKQILLICFVRKTPHFLKRSQHVLYSEISHSHSVSPVIGNLYNMKSNQIVAQKIPHQLESGFIQSWQCSNSKERVLIEFI
jgi:predicted lipase